MPPLDQAAIKIAMFEGSRSKPYYDSASVLTIGYGCTHYPTGRAVSMDDREITPQEALAFLIYDLEVTAKSLWRFVTRQPTLNQWSAMLSLAYNVGWPAVAKSTVLRLFNAGIEMGAAQHFMDWGKIHKDGNLVVVQGLLNRREAEMKLFLTADTAAVT